jgi:hypothetical protein
MTERLEQSYCIKFCKKLDDSQVETILKIQMMMMMMLWASHRLGSGTTSLKMAKHQWIASHTPPVLQQAEMSRSLPN